MKRLLVVPLIVAAALTLWASAALGAVNPGTYTPTFNAAAAPSGTHLQSGSISCTVGQNLAVTCTPYELAGVGHTNADVALNANYSATIDCTNHGGNLVESHTQNFTAAKSDTARSSKNGRLSVRAQSVSPLSAAQVCPNNNWTPSIRPGTLVLQSFTYTLTFQGFNGAFITIAQP